MNKRSLAQVDLQSGGQENSEEWDVRKEKQIFMGEMVFVQRKISNFRDHF